MKILRIIARLNVGGPARQVVWLTKALQDEEFQTVLLAGTVPYGEEDMAYFAAENEVEPVYVPDMSRELSVRDVTSTYKIYANLRREAPDVVHTHTAKAGTVGRIATFIYRWFTWKTLIGRPRKVRLVHTFHGHVFHSYYGSFKTRLFLIVEKILARVATDKIVVISPQQLDEINDIFGVGSRQQFAVIPLGIDVALFRGESSDRAIFRQEIGASADDIVVGFIGRLTEIKNLSHFLDVAAMYNSSSLAVKPSIKFLIVGDGHLRESLELKAKSLGVNEIVRFLGNRTDTPKVYSGLDVVALASMNEGTPLSLIEAMSAERPFVSTVVGGVVDLLGEMREQRAGYQICEHGIGVEPGSASAYVDALMCLAEDRQMRESMGRSGRTFVEEKYSKERLIKDIKELYRSLAA